MLNQRMRNGRLTWVRGCWACVLGAAALGVAGGCPPGQIERNPFVTLAEEYGVPGTGDDAGGGGQGGGQAAETRFRRSMTVTFINNHPDAELHTSFVAWVDVGSLRSADDQDALLRDGYVQLRREVRIGSVYTLPIGTFVYNGPGTAGATSISLGPTMADSPLPNTKSIELITPDVILVFSQPPVSCDSVAFSYQRDGEVVFEDDGNPSRRTFAEGGLKTLAQVDVYECDPLRPGLFLKRGGGGRQPNEYFEGENATFTFERLPDANGDFANVTIGG